MGGSDSEPRSLGLLNPLLYDIGWLGFDDITYGNNPGCMTSGFSATEGWDPISGLGLPDFQRLQGMLNILHMNPSDFPGSPIPGSPAPSPPAPSSLAHGAE